MPVNPFIAALGDVFQGLSVDRANKRKLSLEEEERRRRDEQQLLGNRMALYEAGYRPTGDMEGVLEGLQELQAQQGVIGRALTPQAIAEAASRVAPAKLQASSGYEDLSAKETDPLNLSEMVSNVQRSMQTPLRLPGVRSGEYTNYSVDPTQTKDALARAAATRAEDKWDKRQDQRIQDSEARAKTASDAILLRQQILQDARDKADAQRLLNEQRANWTVITDNMDPSDPRKSLTVEQAVQKFGNLNTYASALALGSNAELKAQRRQDTNLANVQRAYNRHENVTRALKVGGPIGIIFANAMESVPDDARGGADLALITTVARLLDPSTGVKDAEVRNVIRASGLVDFAKNLIPGWKKESRFGTGSKLTPGQRMDFLRLAIVIGEAGRRDLMAENRRQERIAKAMGVSTGDDGLIVSELLPDYDFDDMRSYAGMPRSAEAIAKSFVPKRTP